jgi:tetraacyldisaccharide 4'-kinase
MLSVLSRAYGAVVKRRNTAYDTGKYTPYRVSVPVMSIGNMTTGGTGKTPMAQYIARELLALGASPAIIGRGYKRKSSGQVVVCDGQHICATADSAGDELLLHAELLGIPVIADEERAKAAETAIQCNANVIIMDDGFQHRRLHRDSDIILIDRTTLDETSLLPIGRLREPIQAALRAQCIVCTGGVTINELPPSILTTNVILVEAQSQIGRVYQLQSHSLHECIRRGVTSQSNAPAQSVLAVSGIAHPERFRRSLHSIMSQGFRVVGEIAFADHARYTERSIQKICAMAHDVGAECIITTEKDAVKLRAFLSIFDRQHIPVYVAPLTLSMSHGADELRRHCATLTGLSSR